MAVLRLSTTARNAAANALKTAIDAGSGAGTLKLYDGEQPATPQDAPSGSNHLLVTVVLSDPAFGAAATGVITAAAIVQVTAVAAGTAAWARLADAEGNVVLDLDVGTSGASINLNSTALISGGPVVISSASITMPQ